ncbi:hypothetical protein BWH99_RS10835 [Vibrio parahaemolyticus]|nr:hypothetical protein [Vibrio parahaemolyticus]EIA9327173.1 hypothetical protein [Vibrio parahaemolyticus]EJG1681430.1 hypothetical protein [Vibrio parahaemolyticus]
MAKITGKDLAYRLNNSVVDIPKGNAKSEKLRKYLTTGLSIAGLVAGSIGYMNTHDTKEVESAIPSSKVSRVQHKEDFVNAMLIMQDETKQLKGNNFRKITDWDSAKMAYRDSRVKPVLINGLMPGVEAVYITNPDEMTMNFDTAFDKFEKQIEHEFSQDPEVVAKVQEHHLEKFPSQIAQYVEHTIKANQTRSVAELPLKTQDKPIYIGVSHLANMKVPLADQDGLGYEQYSGDLVDQGLVSKVNLQERLEISATYSLLQEIGYNFALNSPGAFNNANFSHLFTSDHIDYQQAREMHYDLYSGFSQRLTIASIIDAVALTTAAKELNDSAWESLKLDALSIRNTGLPNTKHTSIHDLAESTSFLIKPVISFLDEYRNNPQAYPAFEQATDDLFSSTIFYTNVLSETMQHGDSIHSKLMIGLNPKKVIAELEGSLSSNIKHSLTNDATRRAIADSALEIESRYKTGLEM